MRETPKASAAYNYYAAMGPYRSMKKLHESLQTDWNGKVPTLRRIEEWSARHGWQERVKEYDRERAEEKRKEREERIVDVNKKQLDAGDELLPLAIQQIKALIEAEKFGSQAVVSLLQTAVQMQRIALGADKVEEEKQTTAPIQLIIELDNTPTTLPKRLEPQTKVIDVTPRLLGEATQAPETASPAISIESDDAESS